MFRTLTKVLPYLDRASVLVGAALLALSCGSSNEDAPGGAADDAYASERRACVDRINGFRATLGLAPLAQWTEQEACTDGQAASDSQTGDAHGKFGVCSEGAQNECPGWGSIQETIQGCLQSMWDEGPGEPFSEHGHYINMSNPDYTRVACGFHETASGKVWAIQNFR